jgi:hypothetical protein
MSIGPEKSTNYLWETDPPGFSPIVGHSETTPMHVLNHVDFANPTSNLHSSTFGQILSAADPRILQFALKYSF